MQNEYLNSYAEIWKNCKLYFTIPGGSLIWLRKESVYSVMVNSLFV